MRLRTVILAALTVIGLAMLAAWWFAPSVLLEAERLMRPETLKALVDRAGVWGPLVIIGLMIVSVVASPIPSAPIAMAAGAAYGHLWGTVQIVLGAELGALIAFCIARALGRDAVRRMFGERADAGLLGSQNALMGAVFASRLMPFVSFDMISYAAGLSCLRPWRFAVATFAGIVPASFALVYLGAQIAGADMRLALWAALGLGLITGAPALWIALRRKAKKKT
jgi:uncharacterized membrane protein YdjX (TVP38/TMEM64 family)